MFDSDLINEMISEDRAYRMWEREQKNRILSMVDTKKKQRLWNQLFPRMEHDDNYLAGNVF